MTDGASNRDVGSVLSVAVNITDILPMPLDDSETSLLGRYLAMATA